MTELDTGARATLERCGLSEKEVDQLDALCACGCTREAVLRLRRHRAALMDDLHERQARVDLIDNVVRDMRTRY